MALTFSTGQAKAGVDGCLSGALNCMRAEEGAEWVIMNVCKCGGGHVEGTPEELARGLLLIAADDQNRDLEAVRDLRYKDRIRK